MAVDEKKFLEELRETILKYSASGKRVNILIQLNMRDANNQIKPPSKHVNFINCFPD